MMRNSYKDQFNEWAYEVYETTGKDPTVREAEGFRESFVESALDRADQMRKEERENWTGEKK